MSKQIAQTVGDKRIGWLLAIIAAFLVLATLATQVQKSEALVTAADYDLTTPSTLCTGTVPVGTLCSYRIDIGPITANSVGAVTFGAILDTHIGNITNIDTSGFTGVQNNNCQVDSEPGGTMNRIDCTITPQALLGASGFITFQARGLARGVLVANAQAASCFAIDSAVVSQVACATNTSDAVTFTGAAIVVDKTHAPAGDPPTGANVTYTITVTNPDPGDGTGANATGVVVTDTINSSNFTAVQSVTPSQGTCTGAGPFPDTTSPWVLSCNLGTIIQNASATVTIVATLDSIAKADPGEPAICETVSNLANGTATNSAADSDGETFDNCGAAGDPIVNDDTVGLVHLSGPVPDLDPGDDPVDVTEDMRDHNNDVIGYRHTVCALNDDVDAIWPSFNVDGGGDNAPGNNFQIKTISGTSTISTPFVATGVDCDGDGFDDDSTVSWYSTGPGEQEITVVDDAGSTLYGWQNDAPPATQETGASTVALVKEWNTLIPTWITDSDTSPVKEAGQLTPKNAEDVLAGTNLDGTTVNGATVFNPATGKYEGKSGYYYEWPLAAHANAGGTQLSVAYGATVKFTRDSTSTCGTVDIDDEDGSTGVYWELDGSVGNTSATVTSLGEPISFHFHSASGYASDCTSTNGSTSVTIQVSYPPEFGSDPPPSPAAEHLTINWKGTIAAKQVFLAWAGQRIILEHDWRLLPGDLVTYDSSGPDHDPDNYCPFGSEFEVKYVKSSGPGTFVAGLGAYDSDGYSPDPDEAIVEVGGVDLSQTLQTADVDDNDIVGDPQDNCISRVLFESEDQGQVDIEAFVDDSDVDSNLNATKIAFVVYYMKINTINVSLVTQVSKPTHNSSVLPDYAPGNPWDASADDSDNAAEWNVSKDLLVRGRVTGWFTTSNPSGRAADTSNSLNPLPADRWVMPNDWPLLAGGPADPADGSDAIGTAEQFRPYYDILFAPNNAAGISLTTPTGNAGVVTNLTTVAAAMSSTATTVTVASASSFPVGSCILIDSEFMKITGKSGNVLSVSRAQTPTPNCNGTTTSKASHAVGAAVSLVNAYTPFEGPFSLIDIPGLAASGLGGAALSNLGAAIGSIRDASRLDGDVDFWDAPMPPAPVSVNISGTGFIKQVIKSDVYYKGTPNVTSSQVYPNPYYISNIPDSPFLPAIVGGGGVLWDGWSDDGPGGMGQGPYPFWAAAVVGSNSGGLSSPLSSAEVTELGVIRSVYQDPSIARDLVVFSDNHGEFMVTANGDFKTDLTACTTNVLAGGQHCAPGDHVGNGTITATVDYPDFRGKHFPVLSNAAVVTWTWGGYKDVTVEKGDTDQFKYVVFHAMDRDGFCASSTAVLLHPVLTGYAYDFDGSASTPSANTDAWTGIKAYPSETVDFLIDSGEGIIVDSSSGATTPPINDGKQFATGLYTFSTAVNTTIKEFPLSSLAESGATDECQSWIKVSNSLLGVINILAIAHDDEGNIGFDKIIDLTNTTSYTLNFRWSLITWAGADAITVNDAIKGTGTSGANPGGNDISASVTAIYGWEASTQQWLGFFPSGVNVPGANDLTSLKTGQAYWIAITGPSSVTWTIASNVN